MRCRTAQEVARAIKTMVIRGAPAIGVAAASGIAPRDAQQQGDRDAEVCGGVLQGLRADGGDAADGGEPVLGHRAHEAHLRRGAPRPASRSSRSRIGSIARRRRFTTRTSRAAGRSARFGAEVVPGDARILTHCNAGALATAGYGTALGVVRGAVEAGKQVAVFADETRPFLQGARLTAWELMRDNIDTTVITDNMAGALMGQGRVNFVVVGADRIAANGDTANKIGTYAVALLAREHGIPFYVAAPLSTIDLATADGAHIPIEERAAKEVTHVAGTQLAPDGARVWNPAFDVTPAPPDCRHHHRARHLPRAVHRVAEGGVRGARMKILGIETSCDETSAAVVEETGDASRPWAIRSNVIASQAPIHREWGGVVPELASRQHIRDICGVVERAMGEACGRRGRDLDAIAVTEGPGPRRFAARRRIVREVRRGGREPAAGSGAPSRRAHRVAGPPQRRAAAAGRRPGRVGRPHQPLLRAASPAATSSSAGLATMRPARRTTRSRSCWASAIPAVRWSTGWPARETTARLRCRRRGSRMPIGTRRTSRAISISASAA